VCGVAGAGAGDAGGDAEECLMVGCGEVDDDVCDWMGGVCLVLRGMLWAWSMKCTAKHEG